MWKCVTVVYDLRQRRLFEFNQKIRLNLCFCPNFKNLKKSWKCNDHDFLQFEDYKKKNHF